MDVFRYFLCVNNFIMFIIFAFFCVFFLLRRWAISEKKKMNQNKYIQNHQKKMNDDLQYEEYLEWCKSHGELARDKEGFEQIRKKEEDLYRRINNTLK